MKWMSCTLLTLLSVYSTATVAGAWNNPHQTHKAQSVRYSAITGSPKTLDPAKAYSSDEIQIIGQIYEPPLQYDYYKRPYQLTTLIADKMITVKYYDENHQLLAKGARDKKVAYSVYDVVIKSGIEYQPHPAFAKNAAGKFYYHHLSTAEGRQYQTIASFKHTGTRELTADDYIYEIKRLASPRVHSPIFGIMSKYIKGLKNLSDTLRGVLKNKLAGFLDLRSYPLSGIKKIGPYHFQIILKKPYPQFKYWLAMTFFSPIPWEADVFYSQPALIENNITFNWYPVGTGPFMMLENNPNKQMVLIKNPNFKHETFPSSVSPDDKKFSTDAGKAIPFIEKVVIVLDKESIPRWNKFLQGYYDKSGVAADSFDQAIKVDRNGKPHLTEQMRKKGIQLQTTVQPGVFYIGFNMLDGVVGGYSDKQRKLRQALSIALDYDEYISIFLNGRGVPAQGPIPPGIVGYVGGEKGINPYVYKWFKGRPKRHSIAYAKKLLAEAGYKQGIDPKTGRPLVINYDVATTGSPDDKSHFAWLRKQFAKLGVRLNVQATLYNRFQDKVRSGKVQMFSWGWMADYPDPENFLFLLVGQNSKAKHGGENAANYNNPKVNQLFEQVRALPNGALRQEKINELLELVRKDSPWVWGFHPISFTLTHQWNRPTKESAMSNNSLKYERINAKQRKKLRAQWNQPIIWPLIVLLAFLLIISLALWRAFYKREHRSGIKRMGQD